MSGTRVAIRWETEERRQEARMTRRLPNLSEHRPIRNIPSPCPADPAACPNSCGTVPFYSIIVFTDIYRNTLNQP